MYEPPQQQGFPQQGFPQQGHPQGPQQGYPQGPQQPASGGTNWLKVVGIGCGVLVLLAGLCGFGMFMCYQGVTASKDHAHAFLGELRTGNYPSAYARMDPMYQSTHDVTTFQANVAALPALTNNTDATFTSFNVTNGVHNLQGVLTTPSGPYDIQMTMREATGGYYVTSLTIAGNPLR